MLFDTFTLKDITLKNRIAVSPMCQYSAEDGVINDWHLTHLGALARGGAGLVKLVVVAMIAKPRGGRWREREHFVEVATRQ